MYRFAIIFFISLILFLSSEVSAQERAVLVPKPIPGAPFKFNDTNDLFGQAYRWFLEGEYQVGADSLKRLIESAGFKLEKGNYYIVVANFTDAVSPIGLIHEGNDFFDGRLYGLKEDNLYYIYISRQREGKSFISTLATAKNSPFIENLPLFLGLLESIPFSAADVKISSEELTYVDVRQFKIPKSLRKFSDLSIIIKSELSSEKVLAKTVFDNTSKEQWSYGIGTAITSVNDVDIIVGSDGSIIVRPKPNLDLATFALINYHFNPVDTKAPTFGTSFHILGGLRIADFVEPILGIGGGFDAGSFGLHLFLEYSVEIANELKSGYAVGQMVSDEVDPFKTKLRGKPRFGIEIKFP